jgi:hypothetical protein
VCVTTRPAAMTDRCDSSTWLAADDPLALLAAASTPTWQLPFDRLERTSHFEPVEWQQPKGSTHCPLNHDVVWCERPTGSVAIHRFKHQSPKMQQDVIEEVLALTAQESPSEDQSSNVGGEGGFHGERDLLDRPEVQMSAMARSIRDAVNCASHAEAAALGRAPIATSGDEAWINALGAGGFNAIHIHPGSTYSAVLFAATGGCGEDDPSQRLAGRLAFVPSMAPDVQASATDGSVPSPLNPEAFAYRNEAAHLLAYDGDGQGPPSPQAHRLLLIDPTPGTIVVFPSFLPHFVLPCPPSSHQMTAASGNDVTSLRLSVAANFGACEPVLAHTVVLPSSHVKLVFEVAEQLAFRVRQRVPADAAQEEQGGQGRRPSKRRRLVESSVDEAGSLGLEDHVEVRSSSIGHGLYARVDLPAGWCLKDHPVCVPEHPDCAGGDANARRLPSIHNVDELMREILEGAAAGCERLAALVKGRWKLTHVPRHLEAQGDGPDEGLPEWAVRLGTSVATYNLLAAQLQSNVARDASGEGLCLQPKIRLANHSCAGNMQLGYAPDWPSACPCGLGHYILQAMRPIRAGEELRYSYIGEGVLVEAGAREQRRAVLHRQWGFWCECSRCACETE